MDPNLQPQADSPDPQTSPGDPQTDSSNLLEASSGIKIYPNLASERNPEDSHLPEQSTLPSAKSPEGDHVPEQNYHPQASSERNYAPDSYAQQNSYVQGQSGYVPPAQYGNAQYAPLHDHDGEKARLNDEKQEVDENFKSFHVQCYAIWSCTVAVIASLAFVVFLIPFIQTFNQRGDYATILAVCLWLILQSYFAVTSSKTKSLKKATAACGMMVIALIPSILGEAMAVGLLVHATGDGDKASGLFFTIFLSINLVVHLFLNMTGAWKVRKMLIERAKIENKLIENSFNKV